MSIVTEEVFKTTQELMQARAQHMDNLMQQVYALDAELQMAGSRKGAAA